MKCHYLEETGYIKICRAKGILAPTFSELRQFCYKSAYICPVYQAFEVKSLPKTIPRSAPMTVEDPQDLY